MSKSPAGLTLAVLLCLTGVPAAGQDAARVQPRSYRVLVDNAKVRVLEFNSRPGMGVCGVGIHSHPEHLTVLLTPAKVKVTEHGRTTVIDGKANDVFWEPAVTHEVENVSGDNVRLLIIELKAPGKGL